MIDSIEIKSENYEKFKQETFFKIQNNKYSISSGVNQFAMPDLYWKVNSDDVMESTNIVNYTAPRGNPMLIKSILYYENYFAQDVEAYNDKNICLVAGGTAGLNFVFEYLAITGRKKAVVIGYSYTLFELLANRFEIELNVLINKQDCIISPNIDEVISYVNKKQVDFICLTDPSNPSGEMISEEAFRKLLRVCKDKKIELIIDKCQRDELELLDKEDYFSLNKIISEEKAIEYITIINSYSKTRSLPGLRTGYVIGNERLIKYIEYLNTVTYWHCNTLYTEAIVIDLLYQLVYITNKNLNLQNRILKDFYKLILSYLPTKRSIKKIMKFINSREINENAEVFCESIKANYRKIEKNYEKCVEIAKDNNLLITARQGGYNFCIKSPNTKLQQTLLKNIMSRKYDIEIFTQEDFCGKKSNDYWIRISCAEEENEFLFLFNTLVEQLCYNSSQDD